jgi:hypothetical protein
MTSPGMAARMAMVDLPKNPGCVLLAAPQDMLNVGPTDIYLSFLHSYARPKIRPALWACRYPHFED